MRVLNLLAKEQALALITTPNNDKGITMQELTFIETRVIGCLIEKAVTTPEQYPLSLNSLTTACNQKSNREPVTELDESEIQDALDSLAGKNLVSEQRFGGRVPKYQHRFGTSEFAEVRFNEREIAIISLLFLRGPQTPGELRTRSARLAKFDDVSAVEKVLEHLASHNAGPFVVRLEREPGKREHRWAHLFSGEVTVAASSSTNGVDGAPLTERVAVLEAELAEMKEVVAELKAQLDDLLN